MATTIPIRELSIEKRGDYRKRIFDMVAQHAMHRKIVSDLHELTSLDLSSADVGLIAWQTPITTANTFTPWIHIAVPSDKIFVIFKILQLSMNPTVTTLRIQKDTVLGIHELEGCYSGLPIIKSLAKALMSPEAKAVLDRLAGRETIASPDFGSPMEAYFSQPYLFFPNDALKIDVKSRENSQGDYLVIGGYVFERVGARVL